MRALFVFVIIFFGFGASVFAQTQPDVAEGLLSVEEEDGFDQPLEVATVGPDENMSGDNPRVVCSTYPKFMIKDYNTADKGDSIAVVSLPKSGKALPCRQKTQANEFTFGRSVNGEPEDISWFLGVKENAIFLSAIGEYAGKGMGLEIYDFGKRRIIFKDQGKEVTGVERSGTSLKFKYRRVYFADCTMVGDGADACWAKVKKATGLTDAEKPNCREYYDLEAQWLKNDGHTDGEIDQQISEEMKRDADAPYYLEFDAEAVVDGDRQIITPLPGKIECLPEP
ncbi:MAG: hypothetical protein PHW76_07150 [Alphaproteobacteria bacterium]|nr:hypothetical protein [Alphaproteobacteria bacterium]